MTTPVGPTWFLQTEIIFDCIFVIVTALVAILGWRAYKFSGDSRHKSLSVGFFLLSASYLLFGITNLLVISELSDQYTRRQLIGIINLITVGSLMHALLFLLGLMVLLIVYLNIKERAVQVLLLVLTCFSVLLSHHVRSAFYLLLAVLTLFIIVKLVKSYRKSRSHMGLFVIIGMSLIFIGETLLSIIFISKLLYVVAGVVTLLGYLCILASQIMVMR